MTTRDLLSLGLFQQYFLILRWYKTPCVGGRKLGKGRYALDLSYISLIFETY